MKKVLQPRYVILITSFDMMILFDVNHVQSTLQMVKIEANEYVSKIDMCNGFGFSIDFFQA